MESVLSTDVGNSVVEVVEVTSISPFILSLIILILGLVVVLLLGYMNLFNALVKARQKVKEAWSGIEVQLKRRYDLIPNLVNVVKGYATHEQDTLEKVIQARTGAISVPEGDIAGQAQAENMLSQTLKSIFALSESYPDLKANENFLELQKEITNTEDQIAASRRIYNGNVTYLNTKIESFPSNLVAQAHKFQMEEFFELDASEKVEANKTPKVSF